MPTTVNGFTVPIGTDELRLGADAIEDLARQMMPVTLEDVGMTSGPWDWFVQSITMSRAGLLTHISGTVKRTGSALTVPSNGNVGNQSVGTLQSGFVGGDGQQRPYVNTAIGSGSTGRMCQWLVTTTGELQLVSVATASDIAVNEVLSFNGMFFAQYLTNTD